VTDVALRAIALCSGLLGLERGLDLAVGPCRVVCAVERQAYVAAALVARMEEKALDPFPIWDDLATFDGRAWRGVVDLVAAGFPCQPASVAGRRAGTDDERWLWPHVWRCVGNGVVPQAAALAIDTLAGRIGDDY